MSKERFDRCSLACNGVRIFEYRRVQAGFVAKVIADCGDIGIGAFADFSYCGVLEPAMREDFARGKQHILARVSCDWRRDWVQVGEGLEGSGGHWWWEGV